MKLLAEKQPSLEFATPRADRRRRHSCARRRRRRSAAWHCRSTAAGPRSREAHAAPFKSIEQLMPFATAGELVAAKRAGLVSVSPGATALAAMQTMAKDVGLLVVLENERLVGVVSGATPAPPRGPLGEDTAVRSLMTTQLYTVAPQAKIPECIALMHEGIRHLPVAEAGKVLGDASRARPDGRADRAARAPLAAPARGTPDAALPRSQQLLGDRHELTHRDRVARAAHARRLPGLQRDHVRAGVRAARGGGDKPGPGPACSAACSWTRWWASSSPTCRCSCSARCSAS